MPAPKGNNYALGNEGGRPKKLTPELLERANSYLKWCEENPIVKEKVKKIQSDGKLETITEREELQRLPTIAGLAVHLGISRETVYAWAEEDKEFSDVKQIVGTKSEEMKWTHGAAGTMNATILRFGLSAMDGYREKSDVTTDGKALPTPLLAGVIDSA